MPLAPFAQTTASALQDHSLPALWHRSVRGARVLHKQIALRCGRGPRITDSALSPFVCDAVRNRSRFSRELDHENSGDPLACQPHSSFAPTTRLLLAKQHTHSRFLTSSPFVHAYISPARRWGCRTSLCRRASSLGKNWLDMSRRWRERGLLFAAVLALAATGLVPCAHASVTAPTCETALPVAQGGNTARFQALPLPEQAVLVNATLAVDTDAALSRIALSLADDTFSVLESNPKRAPSSLGPNRWNITRALAAATASK